MGPSCVVLGDPINGVIIIGPFRSADEAATYAETVAASTQTWWVVAMVVPKEFDVEDQLEIDKRRLHLRPRINGRRLP